jgi:hypothetical protein
MSAVLAALRHTEREGNADRAFCLNVTIRYGRKIVGTVLSDHATALVDGGIGLVV